MSSKKILQTSIFSLALLFISLSSVFAESSEIVQSEIKISAEETKVDISEKSAADIDVLAIEQKIEDYKQSLDEEAKKYFPFLKTIQDIDYTNEKEIEKAAKEFQEMEKKKIQTVSEIVSKEHPEAVADFKNLASKIKKEVYLGEYSGELGKRTEQESDVDLVIGALISKWNAWPDGSLGKAIQVAATNQYQLTSSSLNQWKKNSLTEFEPHLDTIGYVLDAMKKVTLEKFQEYGVTEVTLYRGLKLPEKLDEKVHTHQLSALSSFTLSIDIAKGFCFPQEGFYSYILAKTFPIERVLSLGSTGLGVDAEYEFVVMGPQDDWDQFYIITPEFDGIAFNDDEFYQVPKQSKSKKLSKKHQFHKWVDYGNSKSETKEVKTSTDNQQECTSTTGYLKSITQIFSAIWDFIVQMAINLIQWLKELFLI